MENRRKTIGNHRNPPITGGSNSRVSNVDFPRNINPVIGGWLGATPWELAQNGWGKTLQLREVHLEGPHRFRTVKFQAFLYSSTSCSSCCYQFLDHPQSLVQMVIEHGKFRMLLATLKNSLISSTNKWWTLKHILGSFMFIDNFAASG